MSNASRGLRNNNPLNIRHSAEKFQGEAVLRQDTAFKNFTTIAYGYRAAFVILGTYNSRGINTINKIIKTWAPPSDGNNTESYIRNVERNSGINRMQVLTTMDGNAYIKIVEAMCISENGVAANHLDVVEGFCLQDKIKR